MHDNNRIIWLDLLKGLAILCVIFAHTDGGQGIWGITHGLIFSFHMPLFFICAGVTIRRPNQMSDIWVTCKKSFSRLVLPAGVIVFGRILLQEGCSWTSLKGGLCACIFASGVPYHGLTVGIAWFLLCLFWARVLYLLLLSRLSDRAEFIVCLTLGCLGCVISQFVWLPCAFELVLMAMPFLAFGRLFGMLVRKDRAKWLLGPRVVLFSFFLWALVVYIGYAIDGHCLNMAARRVPLPPLPYIAAIAAFVALHGICGRMSRPFMLGWIGRKSLMLMLIHAFDFLWHKWWSFSGVVGINAVTRMFEDVIVLLACDVILQHLKMLRMRRRCGR